MFICYCLETQRGEIYWRCVRIWIHTPHIPNENTNETACEQCLFFLSAKAACEKKKKVEDEASKNLLQEFGVPPLSKHLKAKHRDEHSTDKMPCQAVSSLPPVYHKTRRGKGETQKKGWTTEYGLLFVYDTQRLDSAAFRGESLLKRPHIHRLSEPVFGKMSRILIHMTVTIETTGELMKRQLFCPLLNTESQLNNSRYNLSKWLIDTRGLIHTLTCGYTLAETHPHAALKHTYSWALTQKALLFFTQTLWKKTRWMYAQTRTHTCTVHRVIISRAVGSSLGFIMWKQRPWSVSLWTMTWWSEVSEGRGYVPAEWLLLIEDNKLHPSGRIGAHQSRRLSCNHATCTASFCSSHCSLQMYATDKSVTMDILTTLASSAEWWSHLELRALLITHVTVASKACHQLNLWVGVWKK